MRYPGLVLGACALFAGYHFVTTRSMEWSPGIMAPSDPRQGDLESAEPVSLKGVRLIPRARFTAEVRVLSRSRYWLGPLAKVAPLDIAVGWGPMSDSAVLKFIDISQSGRFYFWHYDNEPPVARDIIETHSANWHLLPATSAIWDKLGALRVGDIVTLDGMLVDVDIPDGGSIRTSLRRDDTGAGACEVILVEGTSLRYR